MQSDKTDDTRYDYKDFAPLETELSVVMGNIESKHFSIIIYKRIK